MSMRWCKVLGDARQYWPQIGLIALVLIVGTTGVVAALNAQAILKREIASSFGGAKSPDIALQFEQVTPALLSEVASQEGVRAVDARRVVTMRVQVKDGTWLPMVVTIVPDFSAQQLGVTHLHGGQRGGAWPPQSGSILVEQSGQSLLDSGVGGMLQVRTPIGELAAMPIGGFVHDPAVAPSTQERTIYAYLAVGDAALVGQSSRLDQLLVKMDRRRSFAEAVAFGTVLNTDLQRRGQSAFRVDTLSVGHPHETLMDGALRVLSVLALLALVGSAALAGSMVAAWMRREVRQVGIMKTLGAQSLQIAWQSLWLVAPAIVLAVGMGLILGAELGREVVRQYAVVLNVDIAQWQVPSTLLLLELAVALCVPLLAMSIPILRAARMTALAAIQHAGITTPSSAGRFAPMLLKIPGNVAWTFSLRNTWRRPWRSLLMVLALTSGGTLLMATHSNYESLINMVDISLQNQGHDIEVLMRQPATAASLEAIARGVPEVEIAEAWRRAAVSIATAAVSSDAAPANETTRFGLSAYPADTRLFKLPVVHGEMPRDGALDEVLVTRKLQSDHPQLQLGKRVDLQFLERRISVKVIGVVEEIAMPLMYSNFATFEAVTALGEQAHALRVKTRSPHIDVVARALDQAYLQARLVPRQVISRTMVRDALDEHVKVVGDVIRMVALAAALVGAIVLAATTVLNVVERTREIGVIRTLGASPARIAAVFLAEGAAITLVSAALSIFFSSLLTRALLNLAEQKLVYVSVPMQFSKLGLAILCSGALVVLLMVALALAFSLRKTVRETLAYE
jgi:putative ABC transport system permease protein